MDRVGFAAKGFVLLVAASLLAVSQARTIVVGGPENWRPGFNYTDWAIKNSPFYFNDKLVFKYDPPSENVTTDVYLLPSLYEYLKCDFRRGILLANPTQGSGDNGFEIVLNQWRPYFFASSQGNKVYCNDGMKFFVVPLPTWHF